MHGVPLGDNFGPMWRVPQCRGGDVGVTYLSRAALAFWLVLAAPGSAGDLALFLPRLPCARCVTAWSDISRRAAHGSVSLACPSPLGCGEWTPWCGQPPPHLHPPPSRSSSQRCRCLWRLSPSPPAVCRGSGASPILVPAPIPRGGRQRRLLLRQSGPGAGPGSAGLQQHHPVPVLGGDPA